MKTENFPTTPPSASFSMLSQCGGEGAVEMKLFCLKWGGAKPQRREVKIAQDKHGGQQRVIMMISNDIFNRSQSICSFVPQEFHSQAGSADDIW